jgi:hypothetical protein
MAGDRVLALGNFAFSVGIQVHGINLVSVRQRIVASQLLGRVNATFRFANFAAGALGALLAAALASAGLGSHKIIALGALGFWLPPLLNARAFRVLRDS